MQQPLGSDFGQYLLPRSVVEKIERENMYIARPPEINIARPCDRIDLVPAVEQRLQRVSADIA
jgi:hypothetical protein